MGSQGFAARVHFQASETSGAEVADDALEERSQVESPDPPSERVHKGHFAPASHRFCGLVCAAGSVRTLRLTVLDLPCRLS